MHQLNNDYSHTKTHQNKLKNWQPQMTPCCEGQVNGSSTMVLRDTVFTTCVVKSSLIKPLHMIGTDELCMLIDVVVKRYPTAVVELKTPYYTGKANVLCMDNSVQEIIIGNIPGELGAEVITTHHTDEVTQCVDNKTQRSQITHDDLMT